jgi:hypothetical protein
MSSYAYGWTVKPGEIFQLSQKFSARLTKSFPQLYNITGAMRLSSSRYIVPLDWAEHITFARGVLLSYNYNLVSEDAILY